MHQKVFVVFKASSENTNVLSIICTQAAKVQNTTGTMKRTRKMEKVRQSESLKLFELKRVQRTKSRAGANGCAQ
jgi:hypothetical protein